MVEATTPQTTSKELRLSLEAADLNEYTYFGREETREILTALGYGNTKMLVDAVYLHKNGYSAVGVLTVTDQICEGHFEGSSVMRGVDQLESAGQVLLLVEKLTGRLPNDSLPRLTKVDDVDYISPAIPGMILNIIVIANPDLPVGGKALILNGSTQICRATLEGTIIKKKVSDRLLERAQRHIQLPTFPLL